MTEPAEKRDDVIDGEIVNEEKPTELVPVRQTASALDVPTEQFKAALDRRGANRKALLEWIKEALVEGTDYGKIHVVSKNKCPHGNRCTNPYHWSKPCLFKPGAEKICGMLGLVASFPNMREYEKMAVEGKEIKVVMLRCELHQGEIFMGEGAGARSVSQDYGDINKAIKMAQKSAHIDATLKTAGLSEMFTQDLDDTKPQDDPPPQNNHKPNPQQKADQETKAQAWTESIWKTLEGSGHPDPRGAWKQAAKDAGLKGSVGATQAQQKKFKECVLSLIDDWRASLDSSSDEAVGHDTAPLDDMPDGPIEDHGKRKVSGDQIDHLIETCKISNPDFKSAKDVLNFVRGSMRLDIRSLEDLTFDQYEGALDMANTHTGDQPYLPMSERGQG